MSQDGSVVSWGDDEVGGNSGAVQDQLRNVIAIQACHDSFAAIKADALLPFSRNVLNYILLLDMCVETQSGRSISSLPALRGYHEQQASSLFFLSREV